MELGDSDYRMVTITHLSATPNLYVVSLDKFSPDKSPPGHLFYPGKFYPNKYTRSVPTSLGMKVSEWCGDLF